MSKKEIVKVTTEDIVNDIIELTGLPKATIKNVLSSEKKSVAKHIENGEKVQLTSYFTVTPQYRAAREANNISTGKKDKIPETVGVSIKAGTDLKQAAAKLDPVHWRPKKEK